MTVMILDFSTLSGTNLQIWTLKAMTSTQVIFIWEPLPPPSPTGDSHKKGGGG